MTRLAVIVRACLLVGALFLLTVATSARGDAASPEEQADAEFEAEQRAVFLLPGHRSVVAVPALSAAGKKAYESLLMTSTFKGVTDGFNGGIPKAVDALQALLREKRASNAFRALLTRATRAGQLYALCGLFVVDHARFLIEVEPYRATDAVVYVQFGCTGQLERVSEMASTISAGFVRLLFGERPIPELSR